MSSNTKRSANNSKAATEKRPVKEYDSLKDLAAGVESATTEEVRAAEFKTVYSAFDLKASRSAPVGEPHQVTDGQDHVEIIDGKTYCVRELDQDPWLSTEAMSEAIPSVFDDDDEWGFEIRFRIWSTPDDERTMGFADLYRDGVIMKPISPKMEGQNQEASVAFASLRLAGDGFAVPEVDKVTGHNVWIRYTKSGLFLTRSFRDWLKNDIGSWLMDAPRGTAGYARCLFVMKTFTQN